MKLIAINEIVAVYAANGSEEASDKELTKQAKKVIADLTTADTLVPILDYYKRLAAFADTPALISPRHISNTYFLTPKESSLRNALFGRNDIEYFDPALLLKLDTDIANLRFVSRYLQTIIKRDACTLASLALMASGKSEIDEDLFETTTRASGTYVRISNPFASDLPTKLRIKPENEGRNFYYSYEGDFDHEYTLSEEYVETRKESYETSKRAKRRLCAQVVANAMEFYEASTRSDYVTATYYEMEMDDLGGYKFSKRVKHDVDNKLTNYLMRGAFECVVSGYSRKCEVCRKAYFSIRESSTCSGICRNKLKSLRDGE